MIWFKTRDWETFKIIIEAIAQPHSEFFFRAGAHWEDGELVFFVRALEK